MNIKQFLEIWNFEESYPGFNDALEELCNSCYIQGYEDGRIDFQESKPFVAYGKFDDFHD